MDPRTLIVAPLLFVSGLCALLVQVGWMRELRLTFGASTAASAAVLAIFMGGLGLGGALMGRRADRHPRPLLLYGNLELLTALAAAISPLLLWLTRLLYVGLGGTLSLGRVGGTLLRLILSALILGVPTLLMGGTLPAASRAVTVEGDDHRRGVALLYGLNTLGAVTGALLATFVLIEQLGTRGTLWLAAALGGVLGLIARLSARHLPATEQAHAPPPSPPCVPERFVFATAGLSGLVFFLMELTWYRLLAPLLGGSSYTFGLILAVALLGIGLGGLLYTLLFRDRPATLAGFAMSCALEAALLALPLYLGDDVAIWALQLRSVPAMGFVGRVLGWTVITSLCVLPPAILSGLQFPLFIALLSPDRDRLGRQVGLAYACNTFGAIAGSLLGGFVLVPLLTAPGAWRLSTYLLLAMGLSAAALAYSRERRRVPLLALLGGVAAVIFVHGPGPSAVWRHSSIGGGRATLSGASENAVHAFVNNRRRILAWEAEGVESSVAVVREQGESFLINGKADGHAWADAPTQVMGGLLPALLHGQPRHSLVVGLGTGSTAGWLGAVPTMERVDVVELEPAILRVARDCAPVNHEALENPRVHVLLGDAREALLAGRERYDVIFSEPSNPYRAGIASLFTEEFYRAVARRMAEGAIFVQWVQAYEVDSETLRTVYATLAAVFPLVETWQPVHGDLFLVASMRPIAYDVPTLRARIQQEPYRTALQKVLRVVDLEGLLARFLARGSLTRAIAQAPGAQRNTDDRTAVEFGFARSLGRQGLFDPADLWQVARLRREDRPDTSGGDIDWEHVEDQRLSMLTASEIAPTPGPDLTPERRTRAQAEQSYVEGKLDAALYGWSHLKRQEPADLVELSLLAELLADAGSESALPYIARLSAYQPTEAQALLARLHLRKGHLPEASAALLEGFARYRGDPWAQPGVMRRALKLAVQVAEKDRDAARRLYQALRTPFSVYMADQDRLDTVLEISGYLDLRTYCREALSGLEPHVPWQLSVLRYRQQCYEAASDPRARLARRELQQFVAAEPVPFADGLLPSVPLR